MTEPKGGNMLSYDGKEIAVGCVLKCKDNWYRRVINVGNKKIITASSFINLEEARNTDSVGSHWTQEEINTHKMTLVEYAPLGVYDKNGKEYHQFDEVEYAGKNCRVFSAIKSRNGDGVGYILMERLDWRGGWDITYSNYLQILPLQELSLVGKEATVILEGKEYIVKVIGVK